MAIKVMPWKANLAIMSANKGNEWAEQRKRGRTGNKSKLMVRYFVRSFRLISLARMRGYVI